MNNETMSEERRARLTALGYLEPPRPEGEAPVPGEDQSTTTALP